MAAGGKEQGFCYFLFLISCQRVTPTAVSTGRVSAPHCPPGVRLRPRSRERLLYPFNDITEFPGTVLPGRTLRVCSSSTASRKWALKSSNCWGRSGSGADHPPTCKTHKRRFTPLTGQTFTSQMHHVPLLTLTRTRLYSSRCSTAFQIQSPPRDGTGCT